MEEYRSNILEMLGDLEKHMEAMEKCFNDIISTILSELRTTVASIREIVED